MASSYIDSLSADFDPSEYTDEYRAAVEELVAAKTAGRELASPQVSGDGGGEVIDLVEALRANVQAAKEKRASQARRGQAAKKAQAASDGEPAKRAPAKPGSSGGTKTAARSRASGSSSRASGSSSGASGSSSGASGSSSRASGSSSRATGTSKRASRKPA